MNGEQWYSGDMEEDRAVERFLDTLAQGHLEPEVSVIERRRPDVWHHPWRDPGRGGTLKANEAEVTRRRARIRELWLHRENGVLLTIKEIAQRIDASEGTVQRDVNEMDLPPREWGKSGDRGRKIQARHELVRKVYEEHPDLTLAEMADTIGMDRSMFNKYTVELGLERGKVSVGKKHRRKMARRAEVQRLWDQGYNSGAEIARVMGSNPSTITKDIREMGLTRERTNGHIPDVPLPKRIGAASGALQQMALLSDVVLAQDLTEVTLTPEESQTWLRTISKVRKALNHAKHALPTEGTEP